MKKRLLAGVSLVFALIISACGAVKSDNSAFKFSIALEAGDGYYASVLYAGSNFAVGFTSERENNDQMFYCTQTLSWYYPDTGVWKETDVSQMQASLNQVVVSDGIPYACFLQATDGSAISYDIMIMGENPHSILTGENPFMLSCVPFLFTIDDAAYLLIQNLGGTTELYSMHQGGAVLEAFGLQGNLITTQVKQGAGLFSLFVEKDGSAYFQVYNLQFEIVAELPLKKNAGLMDYTLTDDYLLVCQEKINSAMGGTPSGYELVAYSLLSGAETSQIDLEHTICFNMLDIGNNRVICRDNGNEMLMVEISNSISVSAYETVAELDEQEPFALYKTPTGVLMHRLWTNTIWTTETGDSL